MIKAGATTWSSGFRAADPIPAMHCNIFRDSMQSIKNPVISDRDWMLRVNTYSLIVGAVLMMDRTHFSQNGAEADGVVGECVG